MRVGRADLAAKGKRENMVKHLVVAMAASGVLALGASSAKAAPFTIDFCVVNPGECTSDKIAEAKLTFTEIAGGDLNDYTATLFFKGAAAGAPSFIDQVQFKIDGWGYEALPSLTTAPAGGIWTPFFGSVPNCGSAGDANSVCADHNGAGAALGNGGMLTWVFSFDLADSFGALAEGQPVNMRASFEKGQFSPSGGRLTTTTTGSTVPEPAALSLLGLALVATARRLKRVSK
jgi:hypothetical protein